MNAIIIPGGAIVASVVLVAFLLYLGVCLYLLFWQRHLILLPNLILEAEPGISAPETKPSDLGMDYEEVWLNVKEGSTPGKIERLHSWWIPSSANRADKGDRVLLYLHGNSGRLGNYVDRVQYFHRLGFTILIFDYRGYGQSEGSFPSEISMYADAQTALDFLVNTKHIPLTNIYLYGHSLGGAIAIEQASKTPNLAGLIIEGSFTSILAVATSKPRYRLFPIDFLLNQRFESIAKVPALKLPILYIHGTEDTDVPTYMSEELYAATTAPKQLLIVEGANHVNVAEVASQRYLDSIKNLITQVEQMRSPG
jgi:fermentation-respiration switch protein FrsA (DUF1100 family)